MDKSSGIIGSPRPNYSLKNGTTDVKRKFFDHGSGGATMAMTPMQQKVSIFC